MANAFFCISLSALKKKIIMLQKKNGEKYYCIRLSPLKKPET